MQEKSAMRLMVSKYPKESLTEIDVIFLNTYRKKNKSNLRHADGLILLQFKFD